MFRLDSEAALRQAFRPKDRDWVTPSAEMKLPMLVRGYFAWTHPAGGRVFLVFATPRGVPTGILFETNSGGLSVPQMCDWCHFSGNGARVGLLTARLNAKKRVGLHVCSDLSCRQKLEDEADRSGRSVIPAIEKLVEKMGRFASETLKIDLMGADRLA